jgi:3-hydroxyacyl-CoA dehydrogenase
MAPLLQQEQITSVEVDRINSHIRIENEIAKSVASADLIIEMVPEKVQIKREVLQQVMTNTR